MEQILPIEELANQRLKALVNSYSLFIKNLSEEGVDLEKVKKASDKTWAMLGQQTAEQLKPLFGENIGIEALQQSGLMATSVHGMEMSEEISGNTLHSKYTNCPWHEANIALNMPDDWRLCQSGHIAFSKNMYKGLIPSAEYEMTQKMPCGDHICAGKTTI